MLDVWKGASAFGNLGSLREEAQGVLGKSLGVLLYRSPLYGALSRIPEHNLSLWGHSLLVPGLELLEPSRAPCLGTWGEEG